MSWHADLDISGSHPLPTVLVILGFIAAILMGVPAYFIDKFVFFFLFVIGWTMIVVGIYLWIAERQSY